MTSRRTHMELPGPLTGPLVEQLAWRLHVIGDPIRIRLLDHLRMGPATVNELVEAVGGRQQNVSKHLIILHQASILSRTKEGRSARYALTDTAVFALYEQVFSELAPEVEHEVPRLDGLLRDGPSRAPSPNSRDADTRSRRATTSP